MSSSETESESDWPPNQGHSAASSRQSSTAAGPSSRRLTPSSAPMSRVRSLQLQEADEQPLPRPIVATGRARNSSSSRSGSRASSRTATSSRSNSVGTSAGDASTTAAAEARRSPVAGPSRLSGGLPTQDAGPNPFRRNKDASQLSSTNTATSSSSSSRQARSPLITRANGSALPMPRRTAAVTPLNTSADAYVVSSDDEDDDDEGFELQSVSRRADEQGQGPTDSRARAAAAMADLWATHPSGSALGRAEAEGSNGAPGDAPGGDFRSPPPRLGGPATPVRRTRLRQIPAILSTTTAAAAGNPIDINLRAGSTTNPFIRAPAAPAPTMARTTSLPTGGASSNMPSGSNAPSASTAALPRSLRPLGVSPPRSKPPPISHPLLSTYNCPICFDVPKPYAVVTPCGHLFCSDCIFAHLRHHAIKRKEAELTNGGWASNEALAAVFAARAWGGFPDVYQGLGGPANMFFGDAAGMDGAEFEADVADGTTDDDGATGSGTNSQRGGGRGRGRGRGRGGASNRSTGPTGRPRNVKDPLRGPCPVCRSEIKGGLSGVKNAALGLKIKLGKPKDDPSIEWEKERSEARRRKRAEEREAAKASGKDVAQDGMAIDVDSVGDAGVALKRGAPATTISIDSDDDAQQQARPPKRTATASPRARRTASNEPRTLTRATPQLQRGVSVVIEDSSATEDEEDPFVPRGSTAAISGQGSGLADNSRQQQQQRGTGDELVDVRLGRIGERDEGEEESPIAEEEEAVRHPLASVGANAGAGGSGSASGRRAEGRSRQTPNEEEPTASGSASTSPSLLRSAAGTKRASSRGVSQRPAAGDGGGGELAQQGEDALDARSKRRRVGTAE